MGREGKGVRVRGRGEKVGKGRGMEGRGRKGGEGREYRHFFLYTLSTGKQRLQYGGFGWRMGRNEVERFTLQYVQYTR